MALADNLTEEKARLTTLLEAEYSDQNLRDHLLDRLFLVRSLLGELAGVGGSVTINGGDASAANQTAVQADAGSDASKAIAVQGVTGGKAVPVSLGAALPAGSNTIGAISNTSFTANAGTNLNTSALALESTLGNISGATGADGGATPSRAVLMGGKHDGIIRHVKVDNHGCLFINSDKATIGGTTSVASSATSVQLLALNEDRLFASFRNDSTAIAYIELGATATTSSVYRLDPQGFMSLDNYTGAISCIWASANGFMRVSEGV